MGTSDIHVGDAALLRANFTLDGVPANPDTVTIAWRSPDGVVHAPVSANLELTGQFTYSLPLTASGTWRYEFVGTGVAGGVQGGSIRVRASLLTTEGPELLCNTDDIEEAIQRPLTLPETARTQQLIVQLIAVLERKFNRDLIARTYTERHLVFDPTGHLVLWHGPVGATAVTSVLDDLGNDMLGGLDWRGGWFGKGGGVIAAGALGGAGISGNDYQAANVTYSTDPNARGDLADFRAAIIEAVAKVILVGPLASSGAISNFSVEGASISYTAAAGKGKGHDGGSGGITVASLRGLSRGRRHVLLT